MGFPVTPTLDPQLDPRSVIYGRTHERIAKNWISHFQMINFAVKFLGKTSTSSKDVRAYKTTAKHFRN